MKLQCQVELVNRAMSALNMRSGGAKHAKSTLALGKEPKGSGYFIMLFSSAHKTGARYRIKDNIKQVFVKFINEGKATIRFEEPPHDLCIRSEAIQLKCFMKLLRSCLAGEDNVQLSNVSNISVIGRDPAPTKLTVRSRADFPAKGLPRTLQSLYINGLKLCNFRMDILQLRLLSVLDLANNEIESLPPELGLMPCITRLYLSKNRLGEKGPIDWRWLLGPKLCKSLRYLDLSNNMLSHIPQSIWKLQGLVTLNLENNRLSSLPSSIGRIRTLKYMAIFSNELKALPCSLMQCKLEYIDISNNSFDKQHDVDLRPGYSKWELYIGDLLRISACAVLKNKIPYDKTTIPHTLVDFLDDSCLCVCGAPVIDKSRYKRKKFELKDFSVTVVFDKNDNHSVHFDCYFCSSRCYQDALI